MATKRMRVDSNVTARQSGVGLDEDGVSRPSTSAIPIRIEMTHLTSEKNLELGVLLRVEELTTNLASELERDYLR